MVKGERFPSKKDLTVTSEELDLMRRGDQPTWSDVVGRLQPALIRYATNCGGKGDAEDNVNGAWARALPHIMDPKTNIDDLKSYMYTVVKNGVISNSRRRTPLPVDPTSPLGFTIFERTAAETLEEQVIPKIEAQQALATLTSLRGPRTAQIFFLYALGLQLKEIAIIQKVADGTIKSQTHRARTAMRKAQ